MPSVLFSEFATNIVIKSTCLCTCTFKSSSCRFLSAIAECEELGYEVAIYRYNKNEEKTHDTFVKDGLNELKNDHKVGCVFVPPARRAHSCRMRTSQRRNSCSFLYRRILSAADGKTIKFHNRNASGDVSANTTAAQALVSQRVFFS